MAETEPVIGGPAPSEQSQLVARLKSALAATRPGVDAALIEGESLADVEARVGAGGGALPPTAAPHVPAGAPGRLVAVPSTPFAKIREGLARLA